MKTLLMFPQKKTEVITINNVYATMTMNALQCQGQRENAIQTMNFWPFLFDSLLTPINKYTSIHSLNI